MLMHPGNNFLWLHIQLQAPRLSLRLRQLILVSSMDLVAHCFIQRQRKEAALIFDQDLAPTKEEGSKGTNTHGTCYRQTSSWVNGSVHQNFCWRFWKDSKKMPGQFVLCTIFGMCV